MEQTWRKRLSPLEYVLVYDHLPHVFPPKTSNSASPFDPNLPSKLIKKYLKKVDHVRLRATSKTIQLWIGDETAQHQYLFKTLYVTAAHCHAPRGKSLDALRRISRFCQEIVIRITPGERFPSQIFLDDPLDDTDRPSSSGLQSSPYSARTRSNTVAGTRTRPSMSVSTGSARNSGNSSKRSSLGSRSSGTSSESDWLAVLREVKNVATVCISINPDDVDKGWGVFGNVEGAIISVREALKKTELRNFRTLRLEPIHAFGIMHCCWKTGPPDPGAIREDELWHKLQTLELQVINPYEYMEHSKRLSNKRHSETAPGASEWQIFLKTLHDWLTSFAPRLLRLKFHWVGHEGPNPLALDLRLDRLPDLKTTRTTWTKLHTLHIGNTDFSENSFYYLDRRVPALGILYVLSDEPRYKTGSVLADFKDPSDWIDWSDDYIAFKENKTHQKRLEEFKDSEKMKEWVRKTEGINLSTTPLPIAGTSRTVLEHPNRSYDSRQHSSDDEDKKSQSTYSSFDGIPGTGGRNWVKDEEKEGGGDVAALARDLPVLKEIKREVVEEDDSDSDVLEMRIIKSL